MTDDELEAQTCKYNTSRIVRLSSGLFALFHPWDNDLGMPLAAIGTLAEIASQIPSVEEVQAHAASLVGEHDRSAGQSLLSQLGFNLSPPTK